tara:strand:- start:362 stop:547 length:186 start_codon:yes stop_codon:yes gene_type:complete
MKYKGYKIKIRKSKNVRYGAGSFQLFPDNGAYTVTCDGLKHYFISRYTAKKFIDSLGESNE